MQHGRAVQYVGARLTCYRSCETIENDQIPLKRQKSAPAAWSPANRIFHNCYRVVVLTSLAELVLADIAGIGSYN
jgi:hypothetical protein